jgi:peptidoglycan/xylan/chitin deacetylase (PgdA/CDA1 family)
VPSNLAGATHSQPSLDPPVLPPGRAWWRGAAMVGLYWCGLPRLAFQASKIIEWSPSGKFPLRFVKQPKIAVLCYHRVGTKGLPIYSALPPEIFEAQMRYLRHRYKIISVSELCEELINPQLTESAVVITYDDGYVDLFHHAFPVLKKYQIPATVFLAVHAIENNEVPWYDRVFAVLQLLPDTSLDIQLGSLRHFALGSPANRLHVADQIMRELRSLPEELRRNCVSDLEQRVRLPKESLSGRMLSWEQVRSMHRGGVSFGSHSLSHRVMGRLPLEEVEHELRESKEIIEKRLGAPVDAFAFPFGQPSDIGGVSSDFLAACGYRCAMTTVEGINAPGIGPYQIRRTQICHEPSLPIFAWNLSTFFLHEATRDPVSLPPRGEFPGSTDSVVEVGNA